MDIKVDIDAAAVERQVVEAVLQSSIGTALTEQVKEYGANAYKLNDAIRRVVDEKVKQTISVMLGQEPYVSMIRDKVREHLTEEIVSKAVAAAWETYMDAVERGRR